VLVEYEGISPKPPKNELITSNKQPETCNLLRMLSIHLHNVILFAHHGLYEHEQINGNNFEVNITVNYRPKQLVSDIEQTINYVEVFNLLNNRMQIATPLLETLVMDIATQILAQFQLTEEVFISIKKLQPPIADFNGSVGVSYFLKKSELHL